MRGAIEAVSEDIKREMTTTLQEVRGSEVQEESQGQGGEGGSFGVYALGGGGVKCGGLCV